MSELEARNEIPGTAPAWEQSHAALQKQVTTLLIGLTVLSGVFAIFIWRQAKYSSADLNAYKTSMAPLFEAYKQQKPAMDAFESKLAEFGRTHPDFTRFLSNYRLQLSVPATTPAPVSTTTPAPKTTVPAAPQKK